MSNINVTYLAAKTEPTDEPKTDNFTEATNNWISLSSGAEKDKPYVDTITSELLDFVGTLGKLAKNIGDVLSVVNKYI